MSDFPELEDFSESGVPTGINPTSDFLSRERELLGEEFEKTPQEFQSNQVNLNSTSSAEDQFGLNSYSVNQTEINQTNQVSVNPPVGNLPNELDSFEEQYPDLSQDTGLAPTNGFNAPAPSLYGNLSPQAYSNTPAVYAQTQMEEESEHIKKWRQTQSEEIRIRDERSAAKREETIAAAEKAIDDFYHGYNTQKEKNIARNKEQESKFLQSRMDSLGQGTSWQRIADLIDLQDSRSKTLSKSNHDLSRFKEILLSLKREGETAPGAAGY
ncbi:clathrin light chain [Melampsora americana]|nr:clathrin light chain [Melampsora americana]